MARIRNTLAAELAPLLPAKWELIDHPAALATIDARTLAVVQLVRTGFKPAEADPLGHLLNDFDLWLIEPSTHVDQDSEDRLDDLADELTEVLLDGPDWVEFGGAERSTYNDAWSAYKFTITIPSERR